MIVPDPDRRRSTTDVTGRHADQPICNRPPQLIKFIAENERFPVALSKRYDNNRRKKSRRLNGRFRSKTKRIPERHEST